VSLALGCRDGLALYGLALDDLHFEHGPLGKIHVRLGKGSRGSGPRERLVPMLGTARALLVWWVTEARGQFGDDFELSRAALFPSARGGPADTEAFRMALKDAAGHHLRGPVRVLTPRVLRHACASRFVCRGAGPARPAADDGAPLADHHDGIRAVSRRPDDRGRVRARGGTGGGPLHAPFARR